MLRSKGMADDWANMFGGVDLHLEFDPALGRRSGLERALRDAIRSGRLAAETRLPATRVLAAELGVARNTVGAAYDQLIAEGFLYARVGAGTFVAGTPKPVAAVPPGPPPAAIGASSPPTSPPTSPSPRLASGVRPRHDLRPGSPDVTTFPTSAWLRASKRALTSAHSSVFDYGDPRGRIELRAALAEYLGRARGVLAAPEQIVITSGYIQALALLTRILVERPHGSKLASDRPATIAHPPTIAMEDPSLPYHREVVRRQGALVTPLAVDARGARTDLLNATMTAVVLTPAHQYPTGVTLHPSRRHAVVQWARANDRLIIEDDYDGEFRYDRQPVGALQGMAPEHVVYVGTASKTLGPALRLAWAVLPQHLVEPMTRAKEYADSLTESLGQLSLAELITSHDYDRHVRACRLRYRHRRDLLVERLGHWHALHGIAAGLHAMIDLPLSGPTEADVLASAAERGLAMEGLATHWHSVSDDARPQGLIVGYGTPGAHAYPAALDVLARVLRGAR